MTQEEKAKRYDERLEKVRKWYDANTNEGYRGIFEDIFPELKESEDERIRIKLITFFQRFPYTNLYDTDLNVKDVLVWLEKQGEKKPAWSEEDNRMFDYALDMIEWYSGKNEDKSRLVSGWLKSLKDRCLPQQKPLFKKGDTVVWQDEEYNILNVTTDSYNVGGYIIPIYRQNEFTIKQKPAWSEEDNIILSRIIADYERSNEEWFNAQNSLPHGRKITWLKSLRPQNRWKPSDEQIEALEHFVRSIGESGYASPYDNNTKLLYLLLEQLKKLKG